jgi:hypothetical protein
MTTLGSDDGVPGNRAIKRDEPSAAPNGQREQVKIGNLARSVDSRRMATRASRRLMSSGQNSWTELAPASLSRSTTARTGTGFGYPGCDIMRVQPFSVMGQDAQPARAWSTNHFVARRCSE